jgi:dCTP deaminase
MSLITYSGILELLKDGVVENFNIEYLNGASLDVRLNNVVWVEDLHQGRIVDLAAKEVPAMRRIDLNNELGGTYNIAPGEFILASTIEIFNLPNNVAAEFRLKSSSARAGLDQALAVWCDPGWTGSVLTMELRNNLRNHMLKIRAGMKIGQMIFWQGEPVPEEASYYLKGQYNHDKQAQPSRGLR